MVTLVEKGIGTDLDDQWSIGDVEIRQYCIGTFFL
jgi:hypothetical protein